VPEPSPNPLRSLIELLQDILSEIRQGRLASLERMASEFPPLYEALDSYVPPSTEIAAHKARLNTLNRLRAHLADELSQLRGQTITKLGKVSKGNKSIKAYQAALRNFGPGAKRGEG
jgi:hypothetical protein